MPATTTDIQTYLDAFGDDAAAAAKALEDFVANAERRMVRQQRQPAWARAGENEAGHGRFGKPRRWAIILSTARGPSRRGSVTSMNSLRRML